MKVIREILKGNFLIFTKRLPKRPEVILWAIGNNAFIVCLLWA